MSERVSEKRVLALLITHRWVFTIRKGELESKWWTPYVVGESAPEVTLFTDILYLLLYSRLRKRRWYCLHIFPCHLHFWLIILLHQIVSSPAELCLPVSLSVHVFVSAWQHLGSVPGSRRAASAVLEVIAFYYNTCRRACDCVHHQALTVGRRFTHLFAWYDRL